MREETESLEVLIRAVNRIILKSSHNPKEALMYEKIEEQLQRRYNSITGRDYKIEEGENGLTSNM